MRVASTPASRSRPRPARRHADRPERVGVRWTVSASACSTRRPAVLLREHVRATLAAAADHWRDRRQLHCGAVRRGLADLRISLHEPGDAGIRASSACSLPPWPPAARGARPPGRPVPASRTAPPAPAGRRRCPPPLLPPPPPPLPPPGSASRAHFVLEDESARRVTHDLRQIALVRGIPVEHRAAGRSAAPRTETVAHPDRTALAPPVPPCPAPPQLRVLHRVLLSDAPHRAPARALHRAAHALHRSRIASSSTDGTYTLGREIALPPPLPSLPSLRAASLSIGSVPRERDGIAAVTALLDRLLHHGLAPPAPLPRALRPPPRPPPCRRACAE